jgi:CRISPR-associated protein Cas1
MNSGEISRKDNTIEFRNEAKKKSIPVNDVEQLFCFGEVSLNSKFLTFCSQNQIVIHFFSYYGMYSGSFCPRENNLSGLVKVKQAEHYLDHEKRLVIAKRFVLGSLFNIRRTIEKRKKGSEKICKVYDELSEFPEKILDAGNINKLMSVEAHFRKKYYSLWQEITNWEFKKRSYRPPNNPINALISFGNSLLYSQTIKEIYKTQLDNTISYLHQPSERRFSLSLDLSEIFKPLFVDRMIFRLINQGQIKESFFMKSMNGTYLNEKGRNLVLSAFDELINSTIYHRDLKRKVKYSSLIKFEAYKLVKHVLGEKEYVPLKSWW